MLRLGILAVLSVAALAPSAAQAPPSDPPLSPEQIRALVDRVIASQHHNDEALAEYERRERQQLRRREKDDRLAEDKTFRVVPTGTGTLRLLVEEHGQPVKPEFYRKQLRDLEQALVWALNPNEPKQKQRVEKWKKRTQERYELVEAVRQAFQFTWLGRETHNGRMLAKLRLDPNPEFRPRSDNAKLLTHVRATVWVDEDAAQVARIEAKIIRDISFGGGLLGKIYRGGRFVMEQAEVAPGLWQATRYQFDLDGRKFLFPFETHQRIEASHYYRIGPPQEALTAVRRELNNTRPANSAP